LDSKTYIHSLIEEHTAKLSLPAHRAILGGFSQGGALSLTAGLSYPHRLGGIFSLSGYLPLHKDRAQELFTAAGDANRKTPIMMQHGESDPVVNPLFGQMTEVGLRDLGYDVSLQTFR